MLAAVKESRVDEVPVLVCIDSRLDALREDNFCLAPSSLKGFSSQLLLDPSRRRMRHMAHSF